MRTRVHPGRGAAQGPLADATKVGVAAARRGFDWPDATGPRAKVDEELAELDAAIADGVGIADELGDVLFAVVNLARHLGVAPGDALDGTRRRFEARLECVEAELAAEGRRLGDADLEELEARWQAAKRRIAGQP